MIRQRYWGVVMFVKVMAGAILASAIGFGMAQAQSVSDIGGPRELPPASFNGQQYVDSRGCVFLRAGLGGTVNWVPRVGRDRRAMCGYPPTFGGGAASAVVAVEPPAAPAPQPVVRAAVPSNAEPPPSSFVPAPVQGVQVAQAPARMAPRVMPAPVAPVAAPVVPATPSFSATKIGCTRAASVPQRLRLTNGGTVVVCTRGDGTLEGLVAPIYPAGSGVGASLSGGKRNVPLGQPSALGTTPEAPRVATDTVAVPEGYELAWKDDRLNPLRGVGTAEGQAMQDQVWSRKVPAQLVADAPKRRVVVSTQSAPAVTVSTKSAPAAAAPAGRVFVQVGSFGQPANADGASARLAALGLPVARSKGQIGGKAVQVVLAGPFGSAADAQAALRAARAAGFGDAFVR